jgi:hypothetical protein
LGSIRLARGQHSEYDSFPKDDLVLSIATQLTKNTPNCPSFVYGNGQVARSFCLVSTSGEYGIPWKGFGFAAGALFVQQ